MDRMNREMDPLKDGIDGLDGLVEGFNELV
jgi:hypothetical protein